MNCKHDECDEPENWPYTTCEYCSDQNGIDCIPGCSSDEVCPDLFPVCGIPNNSHRCGCTSDSDCAGLGANYICDGNTHGCIEGCSSDSDCPQDICDIANDPYTTCNYCEDLQCKPGCTGDEWCPSNYDCVNHLCEVNSGFVLLDKIVVTGAGAGKYTLQLFGTENQVPPAECKTQELTGSGTFTGDAQLGEAEHGGCNGSPLNGEVSHGAVIGGEQWTGASLCIDWDNDSYRTVNCNVDHGQLMCTANDSKEC